MAQPTDALGQDKIFREMKRQKEVYDNGMKENRFYYYASGAVEIRPGLTGGFVVRFAPMWTSERKTYRISLPAKLS